MITFFSGKVYIDGADDLVIGLVEGLFVHYILQGFQEIDAVIFLLH